MAGVTSEFDLRGYSSRGVPIKKLILATELAIEKSSVNQVRA
jgi:hypothetical protein